MIGSLGAFFPIILGLIAAAFSLLQLGLCWAAGWAWGHGRVGLALALVVGVVFLLGLHLVVGFGVALL